MVRVRLVVGILRHHSLSHWLGRRGRVGRIHVRLIVSYLWVTQVLGLVIRCWWGFIE